MIFKDWLIKRGLSPSSADKYAGAVHGSLSQWAVESQILAGPISALTSISAFNVAADKIRLLPIYMERNERGHNMYSSALSKFGDFLRDRFDGDIEADIDAILSDPDIGVTERQNLVKCRIGQGSFRQKLIGHWKACAVTGYKDTDLLIASHIKPWKACTNIERLDPFNGLLLAPNLDKAFDSGLMSFNHAGLVLLSPHLSNPEQLGISAEMNVRLSPRHEPFMRFHRDFVFRSH